MSDTTTSPTGRDRTATAAPTTTDRIADAAASTAGSTASTPATPAAAATAAAARGIDPRSPRFGAGITAILLALTIGIGAVAGRGSTAAIVATVLLAAISALFAWGAFAGIRRHPYGALFRAVIRPRLAPPAELEDPTPPTFAQGVGFAITLVGVVLGIVLGPVAVVAAASLAFVAAFLNSAFGYCLGCQIHLLLARAGIVASKGASAA